MYHTKYSNCDTNLTEIIGSGITIYIKNVLARHINSDTISVSRNARMAERKPSYYNNFISKGEYENESSY